jgi:hypothetical protein
MKTMLRTMAVMAVLLGTYMTSQAQVYVSANVNQPSMLVADAGTDPAPICPGDSIEIGGNPAAVGGTPTYAYAWSPATTLTSSTVANPVAYPGATATFVLTVTDDNNCTSMDTVIVEVTTCVGIEDPNAGFAVTVFPNPATTECKVRVEGVTVAAPAKLELYDLTGKMVFSQDLGTIFGDFEHGLATSRFSKGSYLLNLTVGNQTFARNLIIR